MRTRKDSLPTRKETNPAMDRWPIQKNIGLGWKMRWRPGHKQSQTGTKEWQPRRVRWLLPMIRDTGMLPWRSPAWVWAAPWPPAGSPWPRAARPPCSTWRRGCAAGCLSRSSRQGALRSPRGWTHALPVPLPPPTLFGRVGSLAAQPPASSRWGVVPRVLSLWSGPYQAAATCPRTSTCDSCSHLGWSSWKGNTNSGPRAGLT